MKYLFNNNSFDKLKSKRIELFESVQGIEDTAFIEIIQGKKGINPLSMVKVKVYIKG